MGRRQSCIHVPREIWGSHISFAHQLLAINAITTDRKPLTYALRQISIPVRFIIVNGIIPTREHFRTSQHEAGLASKEQLSSDIKLVSYPPSICWYTWILAGLATGVRIGRIFI
jgi:hypothetical protein